MSGGLALVVAQLSPVEARTLTDEVRRDAGALREKLLRLYEGGAHVALGYPSWRAYWEAEFESHWRTGYRELEAARVDRAIGPWANGALPERQAREFVPLLDDEAELLDTWRELRAEHGDKLTAAKVKAAVDERLRRDKLIGTLTSSDTFEWYTPAEYVDAAREVLGGIDLDPASSAEANRTIRAAAFYDVASDGLEQPWHGRVWLNPPYGREFTHRFIGKLVAERAAGRVTAAVLLLNGYGFDSSWFQPLWDYPLCFTHHRISFTSPFRTGSGGASFGSVFVYLGPEPDRFHEVFAEFGVIVERRRLATAGAL